MFVNLLWDIKHVCQSTVWQATYLSTLVHSTCLSIYLCIFKICVSIGIVCQSTAISLEKLMLACQYIMGQSTSLLIDCGAINMFVNLLWGNQHVCRSAVGH